MPNEMNRDAIEADYMSGMKYKDLADKYGVTINTVKSWKQRYDWNREGVHTKENVCTQKKSMHTSPPIEEPSADIIEALNDNQRLFCEIYTNNRNATQAYIKAYKVSWETANTAGPRLLVVVRVRAYINELLRIKRESIFLEADDIVERYMRIAFADMTDFVEFGRTLIPIMGPFGPLEVENPITKIKETLMKEINEVRFKESFEVDGGLVCQIKQGKDGASIKLLDSHKAMEWLSSYFEINPIDKHKHEYECRKLDLQERAVKVQEDKREEGNNNSQVVIEFADLVKECSE